MTRRVVTTIRADDDIRDAIAHYIGDGAHEAALRFVDGLEVAMNLIGELPSIGKSRYGVELSIPELRDIALQRFPYVVFYTDDADAVRVHRVLHTSRDIPAELSN